MKTHPKHLTIEDREKLLVLKVQGFSFRAIAHKLGKHHSTLSREWSRHYRKKISYQPYAAHQRAYQRKRRGRLKRFRLKHPSIRLYVIRKLKLGWSPEQISKRLTLQHPQLSISHEAIYHYIYSCNRKLIVFLPRRHQNRRKKNFPRKPKSLPIPYRIGIESRPLAANQRLDFGHWEADSMVSRANTTALHVLVERKSRLVKISKIKSNASRFVRKAILKRLASQPKPLRLSITYDNGSENRDHLRINKTLNTDSYFCQPYHSWEKGSVENTIGLIRRFLPKKTDLRSVPLSSIAYIEALLNNRPRKCLNYQTPEEIYSQALSGAFLT